MAYLEKSKKFSGVKGPLLTIVMDGVGLAPDNGANAVAAAQATGALPEGDLPVFAVEVHIGNIKLGIVNKIIGFEYIENFFHLKLSVFLIGNTLAQIAQILTHLRWQAVAIDML